MESILVVDISKSHFCLTGGYACEKTIYGSRGDHRFMEWPLEVTDGNDVVFFPVLYHFLLVAAGGVPF